jgi:hypothetical protein
MNHKDTKDAKKARKLGGREARRDSFFVSFVPLW